jgi:hypothetical protein
MKLYQIIMPNGSVLIIPGKGYRTFTYDTAVQYQKGFGGNIVEYVKP